MKPLSNSDLGLFFADRHHRLAEHLLAIAAEVSATGAAANPDRAAQLAAGMGARWGLYEHLLPEEGAPDVRALCLVRELLGWASPLADAIFAVHGLGSYPLILAGSPAQMALLPRFRRGELIGAFALTEPEAGSDVASLHTEARRDGDEFVLTGHKTLISSVGVATHYVLFANADPAAGRRGITAFLVPADTPGLVARPIPLAVDHPIGELVLQNVRIPDDSIIGDVGEGFRLAMQTLDTFRVSVGAAAVGMARRALAAATDHVRQRVQFGKPLAEQPVVQAHLAEMLTELDAARLLVLRAAWAKDTAPSTGSGGERAALTAASAMAKVHATEAAQRIIDRAVQLHGGRGVVAGEVVEELYRAIRPLRIYEGATEVLQMVIGRGMVEP
jgi:acyl-CoA dehydrogenase